MIATSLDIWCSLLYIYCYCCYSIVICLFSYGCYTRLVIGTYNTHNIMTDKYIISSAFISNIIFAEQIDKHWADAHVCLPELKWILCVRLEKNVCICSDGRICARVSAYVVTTRETISAYMTHTHAQWDCFDFVFFFIYFITSILYFDKLNSYSKKEELQKIEIAWHCVIDWNVT